MFTGGRGGPGERVSGAKIKPAVLCSWVNYWSGQSVLPFLSLFPPKTQHGKWIQCMCLLHGEEAAGLLASFAIPLQKRAWEERVKCPKKTLVWGYSCYYFWLVELLSRWASTPLGLKPSPAWGEHFSCWMCAVQRILSTGVWNIGNAQQDLR